MATHSEDYCHEESLPASDSTQCDQNTKPVVASVYTREELLSLRSVGDGNSTKKTRPSVAIGEEELQEVKQEQSHGVTGVGTQGDKTDNEQVVTEKKKKKKSSGKNKNKWLTATGFEGTSLFTTISLSMLTVHYRRLLRRANPAGCVC
jgi:hypothetical protein